MFDDRYAKISFHRKWIESKMKEPEFCDDTADAEDSSSRKKTDFISNFNQ